MGRGLGCLSATLGGSAPRRGKDESVPEGDEPQGTRKSHNRSTTIKNSHPTPSPKGSNADKPAIGHPTISGNPIENLLTKEDLRKKLNLVSTRGVDELVRRRAIPVIVLGHRTRRFSYPAVQAAIEKMTIRSV